MKFVPKGPINNIPALVQIMAWCRPGDKPLSEPMMVSLLTHICVARPLWVNSLPQMANIHVTWPKVYPIVHATSYPTHSPFIPSESTLPFLRYSNFNNLPWIYKVKVMGEVKVWSHNVSLASYRFTFLSFHVNGSSHSWHSIFKILPWKSKVKVKAEGHTVGTTPYQLISLSSDVDEPSHSYISFL